MNNETLERITQSIQEKLGEENSAIIADDIGELITESTNINTQLTEQKSTIESLKNEKEKLIMANGNLLKQIPATKVEEKIEEENTNSHFSFYDAFDEKGKFKR